MWNIIDRSTNHPFEFTGMKVEVGLYSDSFNFPLQSYNVNNGTITAVIEANTLPAGVFNIMCRYSTDHEQSYCTYRNAFQISNRPCHASEIVEIESYASHIDPSSEDPDAPDYSKCQLIAEELFKEKFRLPQFTADRAIADEHGNRITDTYVRREAVANHIKQIYNQQFLDNPPLITKGYITPEMLSEETKQMLENTGQEITNLPDGEDLQSVHGVLKLADKQYNPNAYSGLGRRILRKNIVAGVNVLTQSMMQWPNTIYVIQYDYDLQGETVTVPENCVLRYEGGSIHDGHINYSDTLIEGNESIDNITESGAAIHRDNEERKLNGQGMNCIILKQAPYLTQDMVSNSNTIYIIRYNYNLNGSEIIIPEGCVLDFQGGSVSNGTIVGNDTNIKTNTKKIFDRISFEGKFALSVVYVDWFSPIDNNYTDAFNKSIRLLRNGRFSGGTIILSAKEYIVNNITLESRININGAGKNNTIIKQLDGVNSPLIFIPKIVSINNIKNLTLCGISNNNVVEFETTDSSGNNKGQFKTNFGFLMAAVGSAVGLGNLWGFPYKMGNGGGFGFLILYLALAVLIGYPCMIGEFAIGTNTTAYVMAEKYGIAEKLPILIAEKMGPHFAVGDTCYSFSEDQKLYNPDGKEIVAKDNSCSILRKEDMSKAYFNCHTDITLPYKELALLEVISKEGEKIEIIRDGRFVLAGTEELNRPFEES